ncbi:MAG: histone deacetylase, partial [Hyphomonas sp.]
LSLSDDGLRARDVFVARACRSAGIPLCGVLGGGYARAARAVARRHTFLVEAFGAAFQRVPD